MSKDRRNSANPHVIRKADPRVDVKVSTAPLPNRAKSRIATDAAQRCKSASNILHRLKVQQAEEEQRKLNESSVSLFTIPATTRKQLSRDSKLPIITPRPLTGIGRERKSQLSPHPQSNGGPLKDTDLSTSTSTLQARGRPPIEPDLGKLSKTLLSSATKRKRAAALLSQRPKTSHIERRECNGDSYNPTRRSIDYSELPSKGGTLSTSNLRAHLNSAHKRYKVASMIDRIRDDVNSSRKNPSDISKTPVRVLSPNIPEIIKPSIRIASRSSSSASDATGDSSSSSNSEDSDDENEMQGKRNRLPITSVAKKHINNNRSSESESSDKSETDNDDDDDNDDADDNDDEDSARTETDSDVISNTSNLSSSLKRVKAAGVESNATDDDTDNDDDESDNTSSQDSDDGEDVDVEVFIEESLLNKVNPPGLPTLDVHEQVYLATQLKEEDSKVTGEIKATKVKTSSKKGKRTFRDELSNDVDSLLETIDETLLLEEEMDTKGRKLKAKKEKYLNNHNSVSKTEGLLISADSS